MHIVRAGRSLIKHIDPVGLKKPSIHVFLSLVSHYANVFSYPTSDFVLPCLEILTQTTTIVMMTANRTAFAIRDHCSSAYHHEAHFAWPYMGG